MKTVCGEPFNTTLCACRLWNGGCSKQCSSKKVGGDKYCKRHRIKIDESESDRTTTQWMFGNYDEERPTHNLIDGEKISWKNNEEKDKLNYANPNLIKVQACWRGYLFRSKKANEVAFMDKLYDDLTPDEKVAAKRLDYNSQDDWENQYGWINDNEEFIHWESEEMTEEWKENLKVLGMTHELWDGRYFEELIEMGVLVSYDDV